MANLKLILLSILVLGIFQATLSANYCSSDLCKGKKHIACNNNGRFAPKCMGSAKMITITPQLRNSIVNKHNQLRNVLANGFSKFQPAARMATMSWHPELAKLAALNVKRCVMKHDTCRNTAQFRYSGQNLAKSSWKGKKTGVPKVIQAHIQAWFDEHKLTSMATMDVFKPPTDGRKIGHFTTIVQDKSTHVGCAVMRQTLRTGYTMQLMACNYAFTNVANKPVYVAGPSGSQCQNGKNPNHSSLCSSNEVYELTL